MSCGPPNLLRKPPTLSLWPLSICGALLVVDMPVALRAGASTLPDWMLSYPVSRVGVGIDACCCLLLLAVPSVLGPPNLGAGLQILAMASNLTLTYLVS